MNAYDFVLFSFFRALTSDRISTCELRIMSVLNTVDKSFFHVSSRSFKALSGTSPVAANNARGYRGALYICVPYAMTYNVANFRLMGGSLPNCWRFRFLACQL